MISDRMDINQVLAEMRAIKAQTQPFAQPHNDRIDGPKVQGSLPSLEEVNNAPNFGKLLDQAVNNVNELQSTSKQLAHAYERGQSGVDITDVMIASQKASVSFQAMLQVRNKLVEAYRDVMNMPV